MESDAGETGNHVTREEIAAALKEVGVQCGDTVMFHSSLSSMGWVVGGADTVIEGFLAAVGTNGTVVVPTLCRMPDGERHLTFKRWDIATSPSCVGHITEVLRHRPDAVRSDHGTHSVSAIGPQAQELTADHGTSGFRLGPWGPRAFARESPWQKFYDLERGLLLPGRELSLQHDGAFGRESAGRACFAESRAGAARQAGSANHGLAETGRVAEHRSSGARSDRVNSRGEGSPALWNDWRSYRPLYPRAAHGRRVAGARRG